MLANEWIYKDHVKSLYVLLSNRIYANRILKQREIFDRRRKLEVLTQYY